jgi:hypothetical protein
MESGLTWPVDRANGCVGSSPSHFCSLGFSTITHIIFLVHLLSQRASSHGILSHVSPPPWPSSSLLFLLYHMSHLPLHSPPHPIGVHKDGHSESRPTLKTVLGRWGMKRNDSMVTGSSLYKPPTSQIRSRQAQMDELWVAMDDEMRLVIWKFCWCTGVFSDDADSCVFGGNKMMWLFLMTVAYVASTMQIYPWCVPCLVSHTAHMFSLEKFVNIDGALLYLLQILCSLILFYSTECFVTSRVLSRLICWGGDVYSSTSV